MFSYNKFTPPPTYEVFSQSSFTVASSGCGRSCSRLRPCVLYFLQTLNSNNKRAKTSKNKKGTANIIHKNQRALLVPGSALCATVEFSVFFVEVSSSCDGVLARFSFVPVEMFASCDGVLASFSFVLGDKSSSCDGVLVRFIFLIVEMPGLCDEVTDRVVSESHKDDQFLGDHISQVPFKY